MIDEQPFDFGDVLNKSKKEMGHANIAIIGKTGVGKSTLLNAVFSENLAKTGVGQPVTEHCEMYSKKGSWISLLDTKGFELENYKKILNELKQEIQRRKNSSHADEHIHVAWFCINNNSNRIEPAEVNFINELATEIPVIVVLTQGEKKKDNTFLNEVKKSAAQAKQVVKILAQPCEIDEGIIIPSYGLDTLVQVTEELIPEAQKKAFIAAQKVDLEMKKKAARKAITVAVAAGTAACAIPLPFADSVALAPIEIGMLASISHIMGLETSKAFLSTLVSSAVGVIGATVGGRAIVTGLLKLIPGLGTLAGAAIGAATAGTMITAMGEAYIAAIIKIQSSNVEMNADDLSIAFVNELKKSKK